MTETQLRQKIVGVMKGWVGYKESDGSHKKIIDIYNSRKPLPRNYPVKYTDPWCATTISSAAIVSELADVVPIECSCAQMIELFKKLGGWQESDSYVPKPGDIMFYDWDDSGVGDNQGHPEHVGMVEEVIGDTITVIEGNYSSSVRRRDIAVNGRYIRGYGTPKYSSRVSAENTPNSNSENKTNTGTLNGKNPGNPYKEPTELLGYDKAKTSQVRESVKWLQWGLVEAGYAIVIDGQFGLKTRSALIAFQKSRKIPGDGLCGTTTRKYLISGTAVINTDKQIRVGDSVKIRLGSKWYGGLGIPDWIYEETWVVSFVDGDRAVVNKNIAGKYSIGSPININDLVKQ
jgi:hypothetical protein